MEMSYWCESCARKSNCYTIRSRPKCFMPITNSERIAEQTEPLVKDSPSLVKDLVKAFCEDGTWLERQGVYMLTLAEAKQRAVDIIESIVKAEQIEPKVIPTRESDWEEAREKIAELIAKQTEPKQVTGKLQASKTEPQIFICPIQDDYEALIEDEPQTDYLVKEPQKSRDSHEIDQTDCPWK